MRERMGEAIRIQHCNPSERIERIRHLCVDENVEKELAVRQWLVHRIAEKRED
jgi:hypothetical protein